MSNRIDQLFKNKLGEQVIPPSEEAWIKVQNGLSKKNKVVIYWRAAAVFALLGLLISAWYLLTQPVEISRPQLSIAENKDIPADPSQSKVREKKTNSKTDTPTTPKETKDVNAAKPLAKREKSTTQKEQETVNEKLTQPSLQPETVDITEEILVAKVAYEKPMVIEFALPTIEESKPAVVSVPDAAAEKSSGIKKFLKTARDVKNGDAEFGNSLRDFKNELFALDLRKDKTRRN